MRRSARLRSNDKELGMKGYFPRCCFGAALGVVLLANAPAVALAAKVPTGPTPRTTDGHPDLTGYWIDDGNTKPGGNLGKDLPGYKLPLTPAGEAALKYNFEHTI